MTTNTAPPRVTLSNIHQDDNEWVHLQDTKSFSRILYTNPVCFLSSVYREKESSDQHDSTFSRRNVMVVSWLTATNNSGRFMMSIHKRRYTAAILTRFVNGGGDNGSSSGTSDDCTPHKAEFVLSVPVQGMEDLVLNVGKASGRWTTSKFPLDHRGDEHSSSNTSSIDKPDKKRKAFERGIDGLVAVRLGCSHELSEKENDLFAIQGTVAHLHCRIYRIVDGVDGNVIDDDHRLILAEVLDAYVRTDYWNADKRQFRPTRKVVVEKNRQVIGSDDDDDDVARPSLPPPTPPPYMTFFGSQSFGYVLPE
jgi:flavin reductase (DIM6/NTAB) family NADH-FMN oxidoreductase RutF